MTAPLLTPKYSAREPISSYVCCIATKFSLTDISELGWNYTKVIIPGQGWRQVLSNRDASFPDAGIWIFVTISSIIHILSDTFGALYVAHWRGHTCAREISSFLHAFHFLTGKHLSRGELGVLKPTHLSPHTAAAYIPVHAHCTSCRLCDVP